MKHPMLFVLAVVLSIAAIRRDAMANDVERERPVAWTQLVPGAAFKGLILPRPYAVV